MTAYKALYDFKAKDDKELSFRKDDVLIIKKYKDRSGWVVARKGDASGYIPANYVEVIKENGDDDGYSSSSSSSPSNNNSSHGNHANGHGENGDIDLKKREYEELIRVKDKEKKRHSQAKKKYLSLKESVEKKVKDNDELLRSVEALQREVDEYRLKILEKNSARVEEIKAIPKTPRSRERETRTIERTRDLERDTAQDREREKEKRERKEKDKERHRERDRDRDKGRDKERERDKDRTGDRDREHNRDKDREHGRDRDREHGRDKDRDGERDKRDKERDRDKEPDRERNKDRERDRDKHVKGDRMERKSEKDNSKDKDKDLDQEKQEDKENVAERGDEVPSVKTPQYSVKLTEKDFTIPSKTPRGSIRTEALKIDTTTRSDSSPKTPRSRLHEQ